MHRFPLLAAEGVLRDAIRRYEWCWLPLLLQHAGDAAAAPLAAPLDVAWVWLAHAIAPVHYRRVRPCGNRPAPAADGMSASERLAWSWEHYLTVAALLPHGVVILDARL